ncbi:hypothetical protein PUN28_009996 [Cardiocondyla obscurior]|uniref:Uncharacterized protein n=1 Tax=Cardiocondyla obscurior TaxID=286306 RepID=A0AAW2FNE8_9HYME
MCDTRKRGEESERVSRKRLAARSQRGKEKERERERERRPESARARKRRRRESGTRTVPGWVFSGWMGG